MSRGVAFIPNSCGAGDAVGPPRGLPGSLRCGGVGRYEDTAPTAVVRGGPIACSSATTPRARLGFVEGVYGAAFRGRGAGGAPGGKVDGPPRSAVPFCVVVVTRSLPPRELSSP